MVAPRPPVARRPALVRLLFAAALVATPVQIVAREVWDEAYPALFQPSFGGDPARGGVALVIEPRITVVGVGGAETVLEIDEVLPPDTRVLPSTVFRNAFDDDRRAHDPRTVAWLGERVRRRVPGATRVEIEWRRVRYRLDDGSSEVAEVLRTVEIDLDGTR